MLRHDELSHVSKGEVWSDRMLSPFCRHANLCDKAVGYHNLTNLSNLQVLPRVRSNGHMCVDTEDNTASS